MTTNRPLPSAAPPVYASMLLGTASASRNKGARLILLPPLVGLADETKCLTASYSSYHGITVPPANTLPPAE